MSNYRRLISYIYSYEGGVKGKNIGFAKLETRGSQCKITVSVKKVYVGGNDIGVYLLSTDREIFLGNIFIRGGAGEYRTAVPEGNVEQSGVPVDQCYGLTIHDVDNTWRSYTTIWEDSVAHAAAVDLAGAVKGSKEETTGTISDEQIKRAVREIAEEFPTNQVSERVSNVNVRQERSFWETPVSEKSELHSSEEKLSAAEEINRAAVAEDEIRDEETEEEDVAGQENVLKESIMERSALEESVPDDNDLEVRAPEVSTLNENVIEDGFTGKLSVAGKESADYGGYAAESNRAGYSTETSSAEYAAESTNIENDYITQQADIAELSSGIVVETETDLELTESSQEEESLEDQFYSEEDYLTSDAQSEAPAFSEVQEETGGELENQQQADYFQNQEEDCHNEVWDKMRREHPKILAFDYNNGCEILTIKPQDIGLLPREEWVYGNNSFLLHGYYNYRYLILAKLNNSQGTPRYLLGVPGHYYSNERYMASMFGFPNFVLSKEQPMEDGRFGYWYTDVKVGV